MTRVVSLVPSATETLLAFGVTPIAVTRFCKQPALPAVGGTKNPDVPAIVALAPDLVVLCEEENRVDDAHALETAGVAIHVVRVRSVDDVAPEMARLAAAVGVDDAAAVTPVERAANDRRVRAFVPIWRQPWMTLNRDTYGSSLLEAIGVANVFADDPERYPTTTLDEAAARRPDVVLAPSEPYPFGPRHREELAHVAPVVFVDGDDLFWWGARTPAAAKRLSEFLDGRAR